MATSIGSGISTLTVAGDVCGTWPRLFSVRVFFMVACSSFWFGDPVPYRDGRGTATFFSSKNQQFPGHSLIHAGSRECEQPGLAGTGGAEMPGATLRSFLSWTSAVPGPANPRSQLTARRLCTDVLR